MQMERGLSDKIIINIKSDIKDLVPGYIERRKNDLSLMREHLANNQFDEIRVMGHKMKGGGKLYCLDQVTIVGGKIEEAAVAGDKTVIEESILVLEDYLNRVEVVIT